MFTYFVWINNKIVQYTIEVIHDISIFIFYTFLNQNTTHRTTYMFYVFFIISKYLLLNGFNTFCEYRIYYVTTCIIYIIKHNKNENWTPIFKWKPRLNPL